MNSSSHETEARLVHALNRVANQVPSEAPKLHRLRRLPAVTSSRAGGPRRAAAVLVVVAFVVLVVVGTASIWNRTERSTASRTRVSTEVTGRRLAQAASTALTESSGMVFHARSDVRETWIDPEGQRFRMLDLDAGGDRVRDLAIRPDPGAPAGGEV